MSRLEEECIMYVGRSRSGIDAGEIDYGIMSYKFDGQPPASLYEIIKNLDHLKIICAERIKEIENCDHADEENVSEPHRATVYECKKCRARMGPTSFNDLRLKG